MLCTFDSLNYVSTCDELRQVFATVKRHLTGIGRFVFDVMNEKHFLRTSGSSGDFELLGVQYRFTSTYDPLSKVSMATFDFGSDLERHQQIPIEYTDLIESLKASNLQLEQDYADLKGSPIDDTTQRFYVIAKGLQPSDRC